MLFCVVNNLRLAITFERYTTILHYLQFNSMHRFIVGLTPSWLSRALPKSCQDRFDAHTTGQNLPGIFGHHITGLTKTVIANLKGDRLHLLSNMLRAALKWTS